MFGSKRFACGWMCLVLLSCAVVEARRGVVSGSTGKLSNFATPPPSFGEITPAPVTDTPATLSPTSLSGVYREIFAAAVGDAVHDPQTPQYRAAEWIINEDPRRLPADDPSLLQRYLCALFWVVTTNDGERPWRSCNPPQDEETARCEFLRFTRLINDEIVYEREPAVRWLSVANECEWVGHLCDGNRVTRALELWGQRISGTLPTELTQFPFLQSISLPWNDFTGTLPVEYARMKHLLTLQVHGNSLEGSVPVEYWSANVLQNFNIGANMMTGSLSSEIGLNSNLRGLFVYENMFTGSFPTEIGGLGFLSYSRFNNNGFTGTIPSELGELVQLRELWMQENSFNGTVPTTIGNMKDFLGDIRLAENDFSGTIPEELYSHSLLYRFDLQENRFNGTFSTSIGQLVNLEILRVSRNQLTGPHPVQLANIPRLRLAWLHLNLFTGNVPDQYCQNRGPGLLEFLSSDCRPLGAPATPCACCTSCCDRSSGFCLLQ